MPAETLSAELIHHILRHLGVPLHAEEKKALLRCALASHVFLALSREILLSNFTMDLDCNSQDAESHIPTFFDLFMNPGHSFTRPLSLNIYCLPLLGATLGPHGEQSRRSLLEGFEHSKRLFEIDSIKIELGPDYLPWPDRTRLIQALGAVASPGIRRLDVKHIWGDPDHHAWIDVVSNGKCPNLTDIRFGFYNWISDFSVSGASPSSLTVLKLEGGMSRLWMSFLNWVERGGAVLESFSLDWLAHEDDVYIHPLLRDVLNHRAISQVKRIYFYGSPVTMDLAHLPSLRFVSIGVDRYRGPDPLRLAPGTLHLLSSLKEHRTPLTIEVYITVPYTDPRADAMSLDDFLVEFLLERRNLTDEPFTIEFRDVSYLRSTDAEEMANLCVPKFRNLTKLIKGEMRRWSMQSVPF